ncbi:MAG: hypothetical protein ACREID_10280 [Planctomycetota bacterium]
MSWEVQHEAAFLEGYMKALEDVRRLMGEPPADLDDGLSPLRDELQRLLLVARCTERSSLASLASGDAGY